MRMISMSILTPHVQLLHLYVSILARFYPNNFPLLNIFHVISCAFRSYPKIDQFKKSKKKSDQFDTLSIQKSSSSINPKSNQFDQSKINDYFINPKIDQFDNYYIQNRSV